MNDGSIIPYVDTCNHLGNTISIKSDKVILDNAVKELYMRTNWLLSDFLFSECSTIFHLFNTYCMNIYGSPLRKYYDKNLLEVFYVAWRKSLRRVWKISNVTQNNLLSFVTAGLSEQLTLVFYSIFICVVFVIFREVS